MSRTFLQIPQSEQPFVAQPHTKSLRPTPIWTMAALAGAGGLLSSMQDMLRFASAALSATPPLFPSMTNPLRRPTAPTAVSVSAGCFAPLPNTKSPGTTAARAAPALSSASNSKPAAPSSSSPTPLIPWTNWAPRLLLGPTLSAKLLLILRHGPRFVRHFSKAPVLFWMRVSIFPSSLFSPASRICCNSSCRCPCDARRACFFSWPRPVLGP